jgi:thiol-disulfide isomerase/thioredoxin
MHAVARNGPLVGLVVLLLVPLGETWAVTAVVGRAAPDFSLPSLQTGQSPVSLADYRGKVVYLDFWSSWCAPCRRAMPHLDALRQEYSREDFEVVGISVDPDAADARRLLDRIPVAYPLALDAGGQMAGDRYGVAVLPAALLIDRNGVVRAVLQGEGKARTSGALRAALTELIEERRIR